ncbi:MAG: glycosyltransferase family 2 protein [Brevibacterium sp.]
MAFYLSAPEVTIVIPAYNSEAYAEKCLQSIAMQSQGRRRTEVIVVDDGSTDDTAGLTRTLMKRFRLRGTVLTQLNTGSPAAGRNVGLDESKGKWVYFVDVDDYLGESALEAMTALGDQGRADVVVGKYVGINRGVPKVMFRKTLACTNPRETPLIDSLNALKMYRTAFARDVGYRFNSDLKMAEDHPFALATYARTDRVAVQADVDCYYWVRHTSASGTGQHLTGHVLPVEEFYAYMFESFAVIDVAAEEGFALAPYIHDRYWQRLLSFDLPTEMRRKRSNADREQSIAIARSLVEAEGASAAAAEFSLASKATLRSLELGDRSMVEYTAQLLK